MPPYNFGNELSLRHLPDVSDTSFSFQIPGSTHEENLLSTDIDFFRSADVSDLHISPPTNPNSNKDLTLSQLTPKRTVTRQHHSLDVFPPLTSTSNTSFPRPTYQEEPREDVDFGVNGKSKKELRVGARVRHQEINRKKITITKGTPKSKSAMAHFLPAEASPAVARLKSLRAEVNALAKDTIHPILNDIVPEKDTENVASNHIPGGAAVAEASASLFLEKEQPQISKEQRREPRIRTSKQKVVVEGGITKKRVISTTTIKPPDKKAISSTRVASKKEMKFSPSPPPSFFKDLNGEEPTSITDTSMASLDADGHGGGVAARLVKYGQNLINPFGQIRAQNADRALLLTKTKGENVPRAEWAKNIVSETGTNLDSKIHTDTTELHPDNDRPLTLSQLSPRKRRAASRLLNPTPPASVAASNISASPLRSSTKRPIVADEIGGGINAPSAAEHRPKKLKTGQDASNADDSAQLTSDEPMEMTVNGKGVKRGQVYDIMTTGSNQRNQPEPEIQTEKETSEPRPNLEARGRKRSFTTTGETIKDSDTEGPKTKTRSKITAGGSTRGRAITRKAPSYEFNTKSGLRDTSNSSRTINGPGSDSSSEVKVSSSTTRSDNDADEKKTDNVTQYAASSSPPNPPLDLNSGIRASRNLEPERSAVAGTSNSSSTSRAGIASTSRSHSRLQQHERPQLQRGVDRDHDQLPARSIRTRKTSTIAILPANNDNNNTSSVKDKGKGRAVSTSVSSTRSSTSRQAPGAHVAAPPSMSLNATRPVEFRFQTDALLEARKGKTNPADSQSSSRSSQSRSQSQSQSRRHNYHPIPDFKALHAAHEAELAKKKENIHPTIPIEPQWETDKRMKERKEFDEMVKEKEREKERLEEEQRKLKEEEDERELKELRKKLIPKAHEVPEWYKDAPKRKDKDKHREGGVRMSSSTLNRRARQ